MTLSSPQNGSPRRRWLAFVWLLGVAALVFSVAGAGWMMRTNAGPSNSAALPGGSNTALLYCIGHVDVESGVSYSYPTMPGRVVKVEVHEGDSVKKDAELFRMDRKAQENELKRAQNALDAAKLKVAEADNTLAKHKKTVEAQAQVIVAANHAAEAARIAYEVKDKYAKKDTLVKEEAEAAKELWNQAKAAALAKKLEGEALIKDTELIELKKQQADKDVIEKTILVDEAKLALDETTVKAPADGKVLRLDLREGDLLAAQPKSPVLIFCPDAPRIIRAEVEQEWAGRVQEGQIATIQDETSNGNGPTWSGKVLRTSDWMAHRRSILPDPTQFHDIRTLECIISIDSNQPPLRIGQRVRVSLSNP